MENMEKYGKIENMIEYDRICPTSSRAVVAKPLPFPAKLFVHLQKCLAQMPGTNLSLKKKELLLLPVLEHRLEKGLPKVMPKAQQIYSSDKVPAQSSPRMMKMPQAGISAKRIGKLWNTNAS